MLRILLVMSILNLPKTVVGKVSKGVLAYPNEDFVYLDRFCFVTSFGNLHFKLRFPSEIGVQSLLLYYDVDEQWAAVYDKPLMSCEEKIAHLDADNNQQIRLTPYPEYTEPTFQCFIEHEGGVEWTYCRGDRGFVSARSRWWFLAISNCEKETQNSNDSTGVYVEYELEMTNGDPSDFWFHHFSADEFYILPVDIVFLIIELAMVVLSLAVAQSLRSRNLLHVTFKMYMQSILFECMSLFCKCCAYAKFAHDGVGIPALKLVGYVFRGCSVTIFILLLLLIAKGYTITRGRLSSSSTGKLTVLITMFATSYLAMFIWAVKVFDPAVVTYMSESLPGYLLALLRVFAWGSYVISTFRTARKYPGKRTFYIILGVLMTLWFWMGPISLCIANFLLDNWVREEVVNLVDNSVVLYGFLVFLVLTWPSAVNKNFPYHVRTTQIGDSYNPDFPENPYEVHFANGSATIDRVMSGHHDDYYIRGGN